MLPQNQQTRQSTMFRAITKYTTGAAALAVVGGVQMAYHDVGKADDEVVQAKEIVTAQDNLKVDAEAAMKAQLAYFSYLAWT
ncbi:hypothetical protein LTR62_001590 [Meristemomyces frigidus]|uniref:Uncharacterized protein n=1 Tax=Meristemomyces frigidus TaxID=1508187 RepID=A0AAN7YG84_9PEZI|nr:hypothetical protein LTR62_001590 [Meristemomyces frigidus]